MKNPFEIYGNVHNGQSAEDLAWEESVLDSRSRVEGFSGSEPDHEERPIAWLPITICLLLFVLVLRLFFLQLVKGQEYRAIAEGNRLRVHVVPAPRGFIQDRFGQILARNTVSFRLVAIPVDLPKEGLLLEIQNLAELLGLDSAYIQTEVSKADRTSFQPVLLAQDMSQEQSLTFSNSSGEFLGFAMEAAPIREYPDTLSFSHVLGFPGIISPEELAEKKQDKYSSQDYIGKTGIEKQYEHYLRGNNGQEQIEVDATGKVIKTLGVVDPQPGSIVQLNIDRELQLRLYNNFTSKGIKGAAVALNPKTGEVLALLSMPGFNSNLFAHGIKQGEYQALLQDKHLPLFNRAIAGTYPPGSTVKPMVGLAALEEGVVTEHTVIVDRGNLVIPNQFDPSISYNFYGWKRSGLGPMTVRSAIAESSDIYFYTVSGGHPLSNIKGLGAEKLASYYRRFGLGGITGLDLQGEKPGLVADPAWKAEYFKDDAILAQWYLGDTYHIGIGQGDMLVTPLQVAMWTATIANNGIGYKPQLFRKAVSQQGQTLADFKPQEFVNIGMAQRNIQVVQQGMRQTITAGSGIQLSTLPITSAGKTGTSQFDGSDPTRTHCLFCSYWV